MGIHTVSNKPEFSTRRPTVTGLIFGIISFVVAAFAVIMLTKLQNSLNDKIVYEKVIVAKEDIPERTQFTKDNMEQYLEIKEMDHDTIPEKVIKDPELLTDMSARVELLKGEVITTKDIEDSSAYAGLLADPVELSIGTGSIENGTAGKIRQGDLVNISIYTKIEKLEQKQEEEEEELKAEESSEEESKEDEEKEEDEHADFIRAEFTPVIVTGDGTEESTEEITDDAGNKYGLKYDTVLLYKLDNIYVLKAYTSDGTLIPPGDVESNTGIITFRIEKADEENFNNAVATGNLIRISKNVNKDVEKANKEMQEHLKEISNMEETVEETEK